MVSEGFTKLWRFPFQEENPLPFRGGVGVG